MRLGVLPAKGWLRKYPSSLDDPETLGRILDGAPRRAAQVLVPRIFSALKIRVLRAPGYGQLRGWQVDV